MYGDFARSCNIKFTLRRITISILIYFYLDLYKNICFVLFQPISSIVDVVRNPVPVGPAVAPAPPPPVSTPAVPMLPLDMAVRPDLAGLPQLPEMETFQVQLKKDVYGLGITVAGYVCEQGKSLLIFHRPQRPTNGKIVPNLLFYV